MKFPILALIALLVLWVPCRAGHIDDQGIIVFGPECSDEKPGTMRVADVEGAMMAYKPEETNADSVLTVCLPDTLECPHPWFINGEQITSPFIVTWVDHVLCINGVQCWPYVFPEVETAEVTDTILKIYQVGVQATEAAALVEEPDKFAARRAVYDANMNSEDPVVIKTEIWKDGRLRVYWKNGTETLIGAPGNKSQRSKPTDPYYGAYSVYRVLQSTAKYEQIYILNGASNETVADTGAALVQLSNAHNIGEYAPGPISRRNVETIIGR